MIQTKYVSLNIQKIRYILFFGIIAFGTTPVEAQGSFKYFQGKDLTISGQSELATNNSFHRINVDWLGQLPTRIQELATNSAGINIMFQTNAKTIRVKWTVVEYKVLSNMTALAVNGLDLYGWNGQEWQYVSSAKPTGASNSATFIKNMDGNMRRYKVYMPLYSVPQNISIGVERQAVIKPASDPREISKKVIFYGSSITQGASAARPGLAYPAIVSRELDIEAINLGFSGSGKMEIEMAGVIGQMESDLIILDCVPNPTPKQIKQRTVPFIKKLRMLKPDIPILMVESIFREQGYWNSFIRERVQQQNQRFDEAYEQLTDEGISDLYYIPSDNLIKSEQSVTVDGTHLSSHGHFLIAQTISQYIEKILNE